jgi:bifunctional UDP-N-acetylglucosamine pyrophosphorylase/glucosamine-1-phosphate N-acetyltransferase
MNTFLLLPPTVVPGLAPLTLAHLVIGNRPLADHQRATLVAADLSEAAPGPATFVIDGLAWLDEAELRAFIRSDDATLRTPEGAVLVRRIGGGGSPRVAATSCQLTHSWDLLRANEQSLKAKVDYVLAAEVHPLLTLDGRLQVGRGTKILPGVVIEGDVIIGEGCKIGPNCYLRGATSIGDRCHVGQAVEIKNSLLMDGTNVGHLSYVGDSILGRKVNFGAGTLTSNLRHDGRNHRTLVAGALVDTGRRKFGAVVGDGVHTGIHTSIYPGRKLAAGATTRPGDIVRTDLTA